MSKSGGKKKQKEAKKAPLAKNDDKAKKSADQCEEEKSSLEVEVLRSDTDEGVEGVTVKAQPNGGSALPPKTTAKDTGLADFGEVDPKSYEVTIELNADQKKRFETPEKSSATVSKGCAKKHSVTLDPICTLRIIILGYDGKKKKDEPIGGRDWKLTAPGSESGKTKADGPIEVALAVDDEAATLEIKLRDAPAAAAADPAVVSKPEDYPIKIQPVAWKDKDAGDVLPPRADDTVKWKLSIVNLDDADTDDGIKGRLHNLGFPVDAGGDATATKRAVKAYQLLYDDDRDGSGALDDVKDAVKKRHDEA